MTALFKQNPTELVAVLPAAGIGARMQAHKPKQYLTLNGKTILERSLAVLLTHPANISKIILAVAPQDPYIAQLEIIHNPRIQLVQGGETRAQSVLNGLQHIEQPQQTWVLVHDAARPCLTHGDMDKLLAARTAHGAILAQPAVDTIKLANAQQHIAQTQDRNYIWLAQTPQFFRADLLLSALQQALEQGLNITDEASAMEFAGFQPQLISGRSDNIKITKPEDLALAEFYLTQQALSQQG